MAMNPIGLPTADPLLFLGGAPSLGGPQVGMAGPPLAQDPMQLIMMLVSALTQTGQGWAGFGGMGGAMSGFMDPTQAIMQQRNNEQMMIQQMILGSRSQDFQISSMLLQDALGQNDVQMQILQGALPGLGGLTGGMPSISSVFGFGGGMGGFGMGGGFF